MLYAKRQNYFSRGRLKFRENNLGEGIAGAVAGTFFLACGDTIWSMAPEQFKGDMEVIFPKIDAATINTIKLFSKLGIDVIVDIVPVIKSNRKFAKMLRKCPVIYINVTCPLEELRRREQERGDRPIGLGESQLAGLSPQEVYDITVDTYSSTTEECADRIIAVLNHKNKAR